MDAADHGEDFEVFRRRDLAKKIEPLLTQRVRGSGLSVDSDPHIGVEIVGDDYKSVAQITTVEGIEDALFVAKLDENGIFEDSDQIRGGDAVQNAVDWVAKKLNLPDAPKPKGIGSPS